MNKRDRKNKQTNKVVVHQGSVSTTGRRAALAGQAGMHFGGQRDLYATMGYPRTLTIADFIESYERQDIAARIIDAFPDATWREAPDVQGDETFSAAFLAMAKKLKLWKALHRLDRLCGLGHYGVLFLGLDGGEAAHQPIDPNRSYNVVYIQPHSERTAEVSRWCDNPASSRFGKPELYRITAGVNWSGSGAGQKTFTAHWSRCIHVAERSLEDEAIGIPRIERIYNRLMDLDKLLGGSAEMYWQNAAMLLAFIAEPDVNWEPEEKAEMTEQLDQMMHGLRRHLRLRGVTPENLAPGLQSADPTGHIERQLDMIAGAVGIPKRILVGTERGELSSAQDENNWAARIAERREQYAGPDIIEEFVRVCQLLGALPKSCVEVVWPEADTLGEAGRADVAVKKADALQRYVNTPGAELLVAPGEMRTLLGFEPELPTETFEEPLPEGDAEVSGQFAANRVRPFWQRLRRGAK